MLLTKTLFYCSLMMVLVSSPSARAQVTSSVSGKVIDASYAGLPGSKIQIVGMGSNARLYKGIADERGEFDIKAISLVCIG